MCGLGRRLEYFGEVEFYASGLLGCAERFCSTPAHLTFDLTLLQEPTPGMVLEAVRGSREGGCVTHATHIAPNDDLPIDALSRTLRDGRRDSQDAAAHASKAAVVEQRRPVGCPVGALSVPQAAQQCDTPS